MEEEEDIEAQRQIEAIEHRAAQEAARLEGNKKAYLIKVPYPEFEAPSFREMYGLEGFVLLVTGLGAFLFSSLTTIGILYIVEQALLASYSTVLTSGTLGVLDWFRPVMGMLAFEGVLVAGGFIHGRKRETVGVSQVAKWTAAAVIVLAGLLFSFGIIPQTSGAVMANNALKWVFAVIGGVGAPLILLFTADNAGVLLGQWDKARTKAARDFEQREIKWHADAVEDYKTSRGKMYSGMLSEKPKGRAASTPTPELVVIPEGTYETHNGTSMPGYLRAFMADNGLKPADVGQGTQWEPAQILQQLRIPNISKYQNSMRQAIFAMKERNKNGQT